MNNTQLGAEITIYGFDDEQITIELSPIQLKVVMKALGIELNSTNKLNKNNTEYTYACFDDNTLNKVILPRISFKAV